MLIGKTQTFHAADGRPRGASEFLVKFPYERVDGSVRQNKRNPELTITNTGSTVISPIIVDVSMFIQTPSLDGVLGVSYLRYRTHGHLIFEPELKPGSSVKASLVGVGNWTQPAAYRVRAQVVIQDNKGIPPLSLLYLVDGNGIKGEGLILPREKEQRIKTAILAFENSDEAKKKFMIEAPINGVWVPRAEPGVNLHLNKNVTLAVE